MSTCKCHDLDVTVWYSSFQNPRAIVVQMREDLEELGNGTALSTVVAHDDTIAEYVQVTRNGEQVTTAITGAPVYGVEATRLRSPRIVDLLTKWILGQRLTIPTESDEEKRRAITSGEIEIVE